MVGVVNYHILCTQCISYMKKMDPQFEISLLVVALSDQSLVWGGNWGRGSLSNAT